MPLNKTKQKGTKTKKGTNQSERKKHRNEAKRN